MFDEPVNTDSKPLAHGNRAGRGGRIRRRARRAFAASLVMASVFMLFPWTTEAAEKAASQPCVRYALPLAVLEKPFYFAGELIPPEQTGCSTSHNGSTEFSPPGPRAVR